ncbi:hypothetical protein QOZ80_9BG0713870 [Eleusine coracana subsp. coracana]|nr:hypothetical protein QOZ80_9BG0713870 [Eleusine coracana subsp. coracana]
MDWRRTGSPTYGRRRSPAAGLYSAPASPAHPLGPQTPTTASPVHPLAARSKARAAAAMAHAMSRNRDDEDDAGIDTTANGGRYSSNGGGRSPLHNGYGYGGSRSPLHAAAAAAAGGGANKDGSSKYFGFALPKVFFTP